MGFILTGEKGTLVRSSGKNDESEKKTKQRARTNTKENGELPNPIFSLMKRYTEDDYWLNKLDKWSAGKLDNRFKYKNNHITFNKNIGKSKAVSVRLDLSEVEESWIIFKEFIEKNSGEKSNKDRMEAARHEHEQYQEKQERDAAKALTMLKSMLNKTTTAHELIDDFVFRYKSSSDNPLRIKSLKSELWLLVHTKNTKSIVFDEENRCIDSVDGLSETPDGLYTIDVSIMDKVKPLKKTAHIHDEEDDVETITTANTGNGDGIESFKKTLFQLKKNLVV